MEDNLVAKAKAIKPKRTGTPTLNRGDDFLNLVIAWLNEEVTSTQAARACHMETDNSFVNATPRVIRKAISDGKIKLERV